MLPHCLSSVAGLRRQNSESTQRGERYSTTHSIKQVSRKICKFADLHVHMQCDRKLLFREALTIVHEKSASLRLVGEIDAKVTALFQLSR